MSKIPAQIIERKLAKEGIEISGFNILKYINEMAIKEKEKRGIKDDMTKPYGFVAEMDYKDFKLEFDCYKGENYRMNKGEREKHYQLSILDCKIKRAGEKDVTINIDVVQ